MIDTARYKKRLESERKLLEQELSSVGRVNPANPNDWEPTPDKMNVLQSDKNERADVMEEYETRTAINVELEKRLIHVKEALNRIEQGTYGVCSAGGEEIEQDRLEANPAATTCKKHING